MQELFLPGGALLATIQDIPDVAKENPAVLIGFDIHQHDGAKKGVGFSKILAGSNVTKDRAVAPDVVTFDGDAAGDDHADHRSFVSCVEDDLIFVKRPFAGDKSFEALRELF